MTGSERKAFAIKAEVADPTAQALTFTAQKTMYGGKAIAAGDVVFVFASENQGGRGLIWRGLASAAEALPKQPGLARQTPRVSLIVRCAGRAQRPLGRAELKPYAGAHDRPEGELHFKLYRQATNKIVGLSEAAATYLDSYFRPLPGS
jgi:hypothetical protein